MRPCNNLCTAICTIALNVLPCPDCSSSREPWAAASVRTRHARRRCHRSGVVPKQALAQVLSHFLSHAHRVFQFCLSLSSCPSHPVPLILFLSACLCLVLYSHSVSVQLRLFCSCYVCISSRAPLSLSRARSRTLCLSPSPSLSFSDSLSLSTIYSHAESLILFVSDFRYVSLSTPLALAVSLGRSLSLAPSLVCRAVLLTFFLNGHSLSFVLVCRSHLLSLSLYARQRNSRQRFLILIL